MSGSSQSKNQDTNQQPHNQSLNTLQNTQNSTNQEESKVSQKTDIAETFSKDERLVRTAAIWLGRPEIEKESLDLKSAFLKKKGLSKELIEQALEMYMERKKLEEQEKQMKEQLSDITGKDQEPLEAKIKRAQKTKFLSLKNLGLSEIPAQVYEDCPDLKVLILSGNLLEKGITDDISKLQALKTLQAVNCGLQPDNLSPLLFELPQIQELNLSANHFHEIDSEALQRAKDSLKSLNLSNNQLMKIPEGVTELLKLNVLNLAGNNIDDIDEVVGQKLGNIAGLKTIQLKQNLTGNNLDEELVKAVSKRGALALLEKFRSSNSL